MDEWLTFQSIVLDAKFDSIPSKEDFPIIDGANWTLERKTSNGFKAHDTNNPQEQFKSAFLFLVKKTRIKLNDKDIY